MYALAVNGVVVILRKGVFSWVNATQTSMVMFVFMAPTVGYEFRVNLCVEDCDGDIDGNGLLWWLVVDVYFVLDEAESITRRSGDRCWQ